MNDQHSNKPIRLGPGGDLAFAIVVLTSYFATFSAMEEPSLLKIGVIALLGVLYIVIGIYGYAFCARSDNHEIKLIYFVTQISIGGFIVFFAKGAGLNAFLLLPLAGHSVVLLSNYYVVASNLTILMVYMVVVALFSQGWKGVWIGLPTFLAGQIFVVVFTQMAMGEKRARKSVEEMVVKLAALNQQLHEKAIQIEAFTIIQERNRLAREIHDGLGHYLSTLNMQIQAANAIMEQEPGKAIHILDSARTIIQEALVDVRKSVSALRLNDDQGDSTLQDRIQTLINEYNLSDMKVVYQQTGKIRTLNPVTELAMIRVIQEGINNAYKHAHADQLSIELDYTLDKSVLIIIRDDGVGSSGFEGGYGLLGLKERIGLINGTLEISSEIGQGFMIKVSVPG